MIKPIKDPYLPLYFKSSKQPKHLLQKAKAKEAKYASQHRLGTISPTTSIELYLKENPKQVKRGRPKKKVDERLIEYKKDFPWLHIDGSKLYCNYCQLYCAKHGITTFSHEKDRIFIFTGSTQIKKDGLIKHSGRELHCKATLQFGGPEERITADIKLKSNIQDLRKIFEICNIKEEDKPLLPIFRSIYFRAKNNLSRYDCESLCNFLELSGVIINPHYRNKNSLKEMLSHLSCYIQSETIKELQNCKSIGLQIDESMDVSLKKILTLNISYLHNGQVKMPFYVLER